jgi:hypothetical protein
MDLYYFEKLDSDPHLCEKLNPEPHHNKFEIKELKRLIPDQLIRSRIRNLICINLKKRDPVRIGSATLLLNTYADSPVV